jgi:cytochrome c5
VKLASMFKAGAAVSGIVLAAALTAGAVSAGSQAPLQLAQVSDGFDPARTYTQSCAACHNSGAAGAPRLGNAGEWEERLEERGFEGLLDGTINGFNNIMPPKGMCFTCSDEELELVLQYILDESL